MKKPGMTARKAAREREAEEDLASQLTGPATLNKEQQFLFLADLLQYSAKSMTLLVQTF